MTSRTVGRILLLAAAVLVLSHFVVAPQDPTRTDSSNAFRPPGAEHPLGTDLVGRDVWARLARGAITSFQIALVAIGLSSAVGLLVGSTAGVASSRVDRGVVVVVDTLLAFPRFVLLLNLAAVLRVDSWWGLALMIALTSWMRTARLVRTEMLSIRERGFVEAARSAGGAPLHVMLRHLAPQTLALVAETSRLRVAGVILSAASLNFLGLGLPAETPTLGHMIRDGQDYLADSPWTAVPAIVLLCLVSVGLVLAGETRDATWSSPREARRLPA